eukprot:TRINITY_DN18096_c0_g1_i1.p1 TRINITY_DN18096_c0_g1~~TRINITY_DN18096_c0_g1_i1.p1  ORF type:complete len:109 (+),score=9.60 TRINITY_DN18096_c0_g1_i1:315-641(+)
MNPGKVMDVHSCISGNAPEMLTARWGASGAWQQDSPPRPHPSAVTDCLPNQTFHLQVMTASLMRESCVQCVCLNVCQDLAANIYLELTTASSLQFLFHSLPKFASYRG